MSVKRLEWTQGVHTRELREDRKVNQAAGDAGGDSKRRGIALRSGAAFVEHAHGVAAGVGGGGGRNRVGRGGRSGDDGVVEAPLVAQRRARRRDGEHHARARRDRVRLRSGGDGLGVLRMPGGLALPGGSPLGNREYDQAVSFARIVERRRPLDRLARQRASAEDHSNRQFRSGLESVRL